MKFQEFPWLCPNCLDFSAHFETVEYGIYETGYQTCTTAIECSNCGFEV